MMNRNSTALAIAFLCFAAMAHADETYGAVKYISGNAGVKPGKEGSLILDQQGLRFIDDYYAPWRKKPKKNVKTLLTIPIETVKKVSNEVDRSGPKPGAVIAFGVLGLASRRHDEFISLTVETADRADVLIFKVQNDTSAATAA